MTTVVSGFSPKGYVEYGKQFLDTFHRYWPASVNLVVYTEEPVALPRGEQRSFFDVPDCAWFLARHKNNPRTNGKEPSDRWKSKERANGYSYRFDAWKFGRVPLILRDAAHECSDDVLIWLDADVVTFKSIPEGWIEGLMGDADVTYLGRPGRHSEIGFQGYRLPGAMPFIDAFADHYANDSFVSLDEWHSAYVFDHALQESGVRANNLTPTGSGHVWFQSPLGERLDHLKGDRKQRGFSKERRR